MRLNLALGLIADYWGACKQEQAPVGGVISHRSPSAFISPTLAGSVPLSCVLNSSLRTERSLSTGATAHTGASAGGDCDLAQ